MGLFYYLTGYERLLILEAQQPKQRYEHHFVGEVGQALTIPCKPTHPDVTIALYIQHKFNTNSSKVASGKVFGNRSNFKEKM